MKKNIVKVLAGTLLGASVLLSSGCASPNQKSPFASRLGFGVDLGGEYRTCKTVVPERFGNIPAHPDDAGSKTRKVNLTSGSYGSSVIGASISPIPVNDFLSGFQVGYRRSMPGDSANQVRDGISEMQWYESGAYAGTYTRVRVSDMDQFRISYRKKVELDDSFLVLEAGESYDTFKGSLEGGWDRYYSEQAEISQSVKSSSWNPFLSIGWGFQIDKGAPIIINLSYKQEKFKDEVSQGSFKLDNDVIGLTVRLGF